jgi:hypothetical protein
VDFDPLIELDNSTSKRLVLDVDSQIITPSFLLREALLLMSDFEPEHSKHLFLVLERE